jgi:hypothetical protein
MNDLIKIEGDGDSNLCRVVDHAWNTNGPTKLSAGLLAMAGMSGRRYRMFVNKLINDLGPKARYLEIGCYTGSTACAALYDNKVAYATCVDHWLEYGGKGIFYENLGKIDRLRNLRIINEDCWKIDWSAMKRHNVYFYDGNHCRTAQANALRRVIPALDPEFIFIVDDWNWVRVREGTATGLKAIGGKVLRWIDIRTTLDGHCPPQSRSGPKGDWHNGYLISVIRQ